MARRRWSPVLVEATSAQEALAPGAVIIYEWHTTKAELLGSIDRAAQVDDTFYARFELSSDPNTVDAARAAHARVREIITGNRAEIARLPDGPIVRRIPVQTLVPVSRSPRPSPIIGAVAGVVDGFSTYTYYNPGGGAEAGFVVSSFASAPGSPYSYGLSPAVRSDLEGPNTRSNPAWQDGGGLALWVLMCVNSNCYWKTQDADLQILDQDQTICYPSGVCVLAPPCDPSVNCARKHISLWDSGGPDSIGAGFAIGDAHHDIPGHACPDDWDGVRDYAGNSVPLNDVYSTGYSDSGNAGTIACPPGYTPAYHNGLEYNVWLNGVG